MATDMTVASTIAQQLGGSRKLEAMIGAKYLIGSENALQFRFMQSKDGINSVKIKYNSMDTYDLEFFKIWGTKVTSKVKKAGIYGDQLKEVFSNVTGLVLSL